jgi:AcrR family transcriptional regulator
MTPLKTDSSAPATTSRSRARRGEGDKLREDIIDAVEKLLLETGDESAVSMRAIAKAVGVTPPAIYMHFDDKDSMIQAICDRRFREMNEVLREARDSTEDPLEGLRRMGAAYVRFGTENPEPYRLLMMTKHTHEDYKVTPGVEPTEGDVAFSLLVEQVTRCIEAGVFKETDPLEASLIVWSCVHGLTALMITTPENYGWPDDITKRACDVMMKGLTL